MGRGHNNRTQSSMLLGLYFSPHRRLRRIQVQRRLKKEKKKKTYPRHVAIPITAQHFFEKISILNIWTQ
jgi:hypothetical protein